MASKKTKAEIYDYFLEQYGEEDGKGEFYNVECEDGFSFKAFDWGDEFYTDNVHFLPLDEVEKYIEWQQVLFWCIEDDERFRELINTQLWEFEKAIRRGEGFNISKEEVRQAFMDFVLDDPCEFLEWLWQ